MGVLAGIAVVQISASRPGLKGDGGMRVVLSQMNQAREMAITQRRNMRVVFTGGEHGPDHPRRSARVRRRRSVRRVPIEGGVQFLLTAGLPDTPDAFGNARAVAFGTRDRTEVHARRHARQPGRRHAQRHGVSGDSPTLRCRRAPSPCSDRRAASAAIAGTAAPGSWCSHAASSQRGFSLVETVIALGVLTTGVLGAAAVLATGMQNLSSSPADVVVTQKAAQAVEAVFSARDSHKLTWAQIRNVHGATGSDGGVFLDGPQPLQAAGPGRPREHGRRHDAIETMTLPGKDQMLGTADDQTITLSSYTREIAIRDVANENGQLRSIDVTITYQNGPTKRTYTLTTFISAYS